MAGERVHTRYPNPVQTARDLVGVFVKFTPRVQHRHDDLQGRLLQLLVHAHGDAPAIVRHRDGVVLVDHHIDAATVAGQVLVDGVIHHLPHQVVQAAGVGTADVHPGPFAHGF